MRLEEINPERSIESPTIDVAIRLYAEAIEEQNVSTPKALDEVVASLAYGRTFLFTDDEASELLAIANMTTDGREASLQGIVVVPELRTRGIGTTVMRELCDIARASGCEEMSLVTDAPGTPEGDRLRNFYRQLGFVTSHATDLKGRMTLDLTLQSPAD